MTVNVQSDTIRQSERIRLLSETSIYRLAIDFVDQHQETREVSDKQFNGLLEFSRSWGELTKFVKHQKERDWASRTAYKTFYDEIDRTLNDLYRDVRQNYGLVPSDLTGRETKQLTEYFAGLLGREFVENLAAHVMYIRRKQSD